LQVSEDPGKIRITTKIGTSTSLDPGNDALTAYVYAVIPQKQQKSVEKVCLNDSATEPNTQFTSKQYTSICLKMGTQRKVPAKVKREPAKLPKDAAKISSHGLTASAGKCHLSPL
jgi:hypothetical protein